ncbi:MAG: DUF2971 domain-containing protein [Bryobacteraceae bacterium]
MVVNHPYIPAVDDDAVLWRYMDVLKFFSLLQHRTLFFPCASVFDDRWEGSVSPINHLVRPTLYAELPEEHRKKLNEAHSLAIQQMRDVICVSCWHESEHESLAMWNQYAPRGLGVAVQTSYRNVRQALIDAPQTIIGGRVRYFDPRKQGVPDHNTYLPYFHKRKSFEHEREVRLIIDLQAPPPQNLGSATGLNIPTDVDILVQRVFLAPATPEWSTSAVEAAVRAFGYQFEVTQSALDDPAVY